MYTVIYGYHANDSLITRKHVSSKEEAWQMVRCLMKGTLNPYNCKTEYPVVLEVSDDTTEIRKITRFRRYIPGSPQCKWGNWGCVTSRLSGHYCG